MRSWGRLPEQAIEELRRIEWDHSGRLRERLMGIRPFPILCALKPPTGNQALDDLEHFHHYIRAWHEWPWPHQVIWEKKRFRQVGESDVPVRLKIESTQALIVILGESAIERSRDWTSRMEPLLSLNEALFPTLVRQLHALETLSMADIHLLTKVLPQLQPGMGRQRYLRALPLHGVDTKFVEHNQTLITALLDALHEQKISSQGGLETWLNSRNTPSNWFHVKLLCPTVRSGLAGIELLQLPLDQLLNLSLPIHNVVVVENLQAGYELPELASTIAIFGAGANTGWLQAGWLKDKRIGYWGDIDTWGFKFLAQARQKQPHVEALMMDEATLLAHLERGVAEERTSELPAYGLTAAECLLFDALRTRAHGIGRLEQERLSQDYVEQCLMRWWEQAPNQT